MFGIPVFFTYFCLLLVLLLLLLFLMFSSSEVLRVLHGGSYLTAIFAMV